MLTPTLTHELIRLEPLAVSHSDALLRLVDASLWAGMSVAVPNSLAAMESYVTSLINDTQRFAFAVVEVDTHEVVGSTSLYEYVPAQKRVEIGSTFYGRSVWGTYVNPACKLLLLRHAFDSLDVQRVALRCDNRNERSKAAILKLGAQYEGLLRQHRIAANGSSGDTAYFSIVRSEWPAVAVALEARLVS